MAEITIDQAALQRVIRKLGSIEKMNTALKPAMKESLGYLHKRMGRKPPKAAGAFTAMATPGQRRAYWWRVKSGKITHGSGGYVRDGSVTKKWAQEVSTTSNGLIGKLGNNAKPGAYYVYTRDGQSKAPYLAASGWPTIEDVNEQAAPHIGRIFQRHIKQILAK